MNHFTSTLIPGTTLVCATHNRVEALRDTLQEKLSLEGVGRYVFVLDGCTDGTRVLLEDARANDQRIQIVEIPKSGVQAARNAGVAATFTEWIAFLDDDDHAHPDYIELLHDAARKLDADLVGAPWLNCADAEVSAGETARIAKEHAVDIIGLQTPVTVFSRRIVASPYMHSACMMRTSVAQGFPFAACYRGNSWREETDVFVRIAEAGHMVARTSQTYTWSDRRYGGGHRRSRLWYEWWVFANDAVFHFRHRAFLARTESHWRGWFVEWLSAYVSRESKLVSTGVKAKWNRLVYRAS